ncbi:MAG: dihydroorotate dehydrogenase electron transfer subunit [Lachnospiraceae bacterium]|nr:dihydroorotate dehydrogenase electron transfer subunit [Lachnospiraceae bacterium]
MSDKRKCIARIESQSRLAEGVYSMWLSFPEDGGIAGEAVPGQFISMYSSDGSRLLPRPISICEINAPQNMLRVVYRIVGKGTEEFSHMEPGGRIGVIAPLGNGFDTTYAEKGKKVLLIGGGIGIPPMLGLAAAVKGEVTAVLGYRDGSLFLKEDFLPYANVYISTEDGSRGVKGNVIDAVRHYGIAADIIYACGPLPMLRGVKSYAKENGIKAQVSLEERMACGIGACLGCVCTSKEKDVHTNVNNKRICKDGPVFDAMEIEF